MNMTAKFATDFLTLRSIEVSGRELRCRFANDDVVTLRTTQLLPQGFDKPRWSKAKLSSGGWTIHVPAAPEPFEVPSDVVRNLTHEGFARHMAARAGSRSRELGKQLGELRKSRGLSQRRVADIAGIEPSNLSRIENGSFDIAASTLLKIMSALSARPQELGL
jgi:DNA-binding Xre family transcriptional regulator